MNRHVTTEQLLEFLDGTLRDAGKSQVEEHLGACPACRKAMNDFRYLDRSLRKTPLVHASRGLTGNVMSRVLSGGKEPFTFRLLTGLAYAFAMLIVLVVLGIVFVATGVLQVQSGGGGTNRFQSIFDAASTTLDAIPAAMTSWITEYIPFMFGSGSIGITTAILGVVAMLFVLDRIIGSRIVGRLR
jgi:predicted anti-sigma-YlaC factor YlaD